MSSPSLGDLLTEQFYAWEERGRGLALWPDPVRLEPVFCPFRGHSAPHRPVEDDGRRPTFLSTLADQFLGRQPHEKAVIPVVDDPEPQPVELMEDDELQAFDLHLPHDEVVRPEIMHAALAAIRLARYPVSWEMSGTQNGVALQLVMRASDVPLTRSTLLAAFPQLAITRADDRFETFATGSPDKRRCLVIEASLGREFMLPLPVPKSFDPDPLSGFVAAMEDLAEDEFAFLQVLFEAANAPWTESIYRAVTTADGEDFFVNAPEIAALGKQKALQPLFGVAVRILLAACDPSRIERRLPRLAAAFERYGAAGRNALVPIEEERMHLETDLLRRRSHRSGMLLGADELATLFHPPSASLHSSRLLARTHRATRAFAPSERRGIAIGTNTHAGEATAVLLSEADLRRHVHVVGASGSGKSNFMLHTLRNLVEAGYGVALLDPHGDLADDFLKLIPTAREEDIVLLDAGDPESPVGLNVLSATSELERTLLGSDLVSVFRRLTTSWGDQMHAVFANAIQAFLESPAGGTLADLRRFLVEAAYRKEYLATIEDEHVRYYWEREFPLLRGRPEGPILTRLEAFLRTKLVRRIVAGDRADLDVRKLIDGGGILVVKLAHGAIGEENAALLGSFLVAKLHQVALSRQAARERPTFILAIDEFQHFVTPSMATLLSGARKFGLGLLLAHQDLRQVESRDREVAAALLANAGARIVFRTSDADARTLAEGFAHFAAEDIRTLPIGQAIGRVGGADRDFNLDVPLVGSLTAMPPLLRSSRFLVSPPVTPNADFNLMAAGSTHLESQSAPSTSSEETTPQPVTPVARAERSPHSTGAATGSTQTSLLGRGGPQHKYLQNLLKSLAESRGYRATVEKQVDGGSIDLFLENDTTSIACEISVASTTEYELHNIGKCLRAHAGQVLVIVTKTGALDRLRSEAQRAYAADLARIAVVTPEDATARISQLHEATPSEKRVGGYRVKVNYRNTRSTDAGSQADTISKVLAQSLRRLKP